jgi:hypothetical protein
MIPLMIALRARRNEYTFFSVFANRSRWECPILIHIRFRGPTFSNSNGKHLISVANETTTRNYYTTAWDNEEADYGMKSLFIFS